MEHLLEFMMDMETSCFVNNTLFPNLKKFATEHQEMSADVIRKAFLTTDEEFLSLVKQHWFKKPELAVVGSCCLVGVICSGLLYIANVGDSCVVLGRAEKAAMEHNVNNELARDEVRSLHPQDPEIVCVIRKVWRVKGIIQVSMSIGNAFLKSAEFNQELLLPKYRLRESFSKPILNADPSIFIHRLTSKDQFLIFASDGLWEHLSNQEAVDIVHRQPRNGISRRLIEAALRVAAKKREMRYSDLKMINRVVRRHFHDDITVVVVFLDPYSMSRSSSHSPILSIRGGSGMPSSP